MSEPKTCPMNFCAGNSFPCIEDRCAWWIEGNDSGCALASGVHKQRKTIVVLEYIHNVMREIHSVVRARL